VSSERDPDEIPGYLQRWRIEREASLDFTELQATLNQLAMSLLIIMVPSPEAQDAVMVSRNVNTTLRQEDDFWFLHGYPGNKDYQRAYNGLQYRPREFRIIRARARRHRWAVSRFLTARPCDRPPKASQARPTPAKQNAPLLRGV